jgi:uncharacterized protein (UPF0303 family)
LAEQERLLVFSRFGPEEAWTLGNVVREFGLAQGAPIAIDVSLRDRTLFHCAMPGSVTDNAEWIRRKRNTVLRLWRSSYAVGRALALSGETQEEAHNLPLPTTPCMAAASRFCCMARVASGRSPSRACRSATITGSWPMVSRRS